MAERIKKIFKHQIENVNLIIGPSQLKQLPQLLDELVFHKKTQKHITFEQRKYNYITKQEVYHVSEHINNFYQFKPKRYSFVRITQGCNKFCSFCVVPYTRGHELHRAPAHIIKEIQILIEANIYEIILLGQSINHYHFTKNSLRYTSFAELLFKIHESVPQLTRLKFLTSHPKNFTTDILEVMSKCNRISKYLHIPVQSGSNSVLRKMNRGYTVEEYLKLIEETKKKIPTVSILGDIIVGFPGETERDFQSSIKLITQIRYKNLFVFKYSQRHNTIAFKKFTDNISEHIKNLRHKKVISIQKRITEMHYKRLQEKELEVLVEDIVTTNITSNDKRSSTSILLCKTNNDYIIHIHGSHKFLGKKILVRIVLTKQFYAVGKMIFTCLKQNNGL